MELLTVKETSSYLKISERAIYNRVYRNEIPFVRVGKKLRFSKSKLNEWIANTS